MNDVNVDQLYKTIREYIPTADPATRDTIVDLAEFLLDRFIITERGDQCPEVTNTGRHCEVKHPHKRHETTMSNGGTFAWTESSYGRSVT